MALFFVSVGCSGRSLDVGDTLAANDAGATPSPNGTTDGATGQETNRQNDATPATPSPKTLTKAEAEALCADPKHGPLDPWKTAEELTARASGLWFACTPGNSSTFFQGSPGIELVADGTWFHIEPNAQGGWDRILGIGHQGTWEPPGPTHSYVSMMHSNGSFFVTTLEFETSPRRMLAQHLSTDKYWLVPLQ